MYIYHDMENAVYYFIAIVIAGMVSQWLIQLIYCVYKTICQIFYWYNSMYYCANRLAINIDSTFNRINNMCDHIVKNYANSSVDDDHNKNESENAIACSRRKLKVPANCTRGIAENNHNLQESCCINVLIQKLSSMLTYENITNCYVPSCVKIYKIIRSQIDEKPKKKVIDMSLIDEILNSDSTNSIENVK